MSSIRCNMCEREFDSDEDLALLLDENGEWFRGCPDCKTDEYLMDLPYPLIPKKKPRRRLGPGEVITSLDEMLAQKFIWWMGKPYHNGWFGSWQMRWAATRLREGQIRRVIVIEEDE